MSHCMNLEFATFNWQSPVYNIEFFAIIFSHSFWKSYDQIGAF